MNLGHFGVPHTPRRVRRVMPTDRIEALLVVSASLIRHGYTADECTEILRQIDHGHPAVEALKQMGVKS